jgi:hypothetical protein
VDFFINCSQKGQRNEIVVPKSKMNKNNKIKLLHLFFGECGKAAYVNKIKEKNP